MSIRATMRAVTGLAALMIALPAQAEHAPQARLVHCGQNTCLRLSGHRPRPGVAIRIAGQELAVIGNRDWAVTVPLWTAQGWERSFGDTLTLTYFDPQSKSASAQDVVLPPGALGRHTQLASLVVRAD